MKPIECWAFVHESRGNILVDGYHRSEDEVWADLFKDLNLVKIAKDQGARVVRVRIEEIE